MLGVMSTQEAQAKARDAGTDLVLVTEKSQPPLVKVIDLAKFKYQLQQKEAESRKKARSQKTKEIQLSPFISEGDYQTKLKRVIEFLSKGDKVRLVTTEFKGRLVTKKEFGQEIIHKMIAETTELAIVEIPPQAAGRKLMAQLMPSKIKK